MSKRKVKKDHQEPLWEGQPCIVIASGPSLAFDNYADIELVRKSGIKVIAVNSTWEKVRFCDVIYAGDNAWWRYNHKKIDINAERWACSKSPVHLYGCKYRARYVKPGYNSGANAIELAANIYKANPVILLGFDCSVKHGVHHHGNHKNTSNPTQDRCERWKPQFKSLLNCTQNTEIINCSRYTEINFFPKSDLKETLKKLYLLP